jgi:hypothetical protein
MFPHCIARRGLLNCCQPAFLLNQYTLRYSFKLLRRACGRVQWSLREALPHLGNVNSKAFSAHSILNFFKSKGKITFCGNDLMDHALKGKTLKPLPHFVLDLSPINFEPKEEPE